MSKLYSGEKIIKGLVRMGFKVVSTKGSHIKLRGIRSGKLQTVIVPKHKEVAMGTMRSLLKQAAVEIEDLKKNI